MLICEREDGESERVGEEGVVELDLDFFCVLSM